MSRASRATLLLAALVALGEGAARAGELRTDLTKALVPLKAIRPGGPPPDGIPAIDRPVFVAPTAAAAWLRPNEPVLAVDAGHNTVRRVGRNAEREEPGGSGRCPAWYQAPTPTMAAAEVEGERNCGRAGLLDVLAEFPGMEAVAGALVARLGCFVEHVREADGP